MGESEPNFHESAALSPPPQTHTTHTFLGYEAPGSSGTGKKAKAKLNKFNFHYSRLRYIFAFDRNTVVPRHSKSNKFICYALGFFVHL